MVMRADPTPDLPPQADYGDAGDFRAFEAFWADQIASAQKAQEAWRGRAIEAWRCYRNESMGVRQSPLNPDRDEVSRDWDAPTVNVFSSNIELQRPLIFGHTPIPVVTRRHGPGGPTARAAAEVLRKVLSCLLDQHYWDPQEVMDRVVDDFLIGGRGMAEVIYEPGEGPAERPPVPLSWDGRRWLTPEGDVVPSDLVERVGTSDQNRAVYRRHIRGKPKPESARLLYVNPFHVLIHPAERWDEARWVACKERPTEEEVAERWGPEVAARASYDDGPVDEDDEPITDQSDPEGADRYRRARLWRIFDRKSRQIIWLDDLEVRRHTEEDTHARPSRVIFIESGEVGLNDFLPFPQPLQTFQSNSEQTPVPDFVQYQALFEMLQRMSFRWYYLIDAIRMKGLVSGRLAATAPRLFDNDDPAVALVPLTNASPNVEDAGKVIAWIPIGEIVQAAQAVQNVMTAITSLMHEVSGMSDVLRGHSSPRETATAQRIKAEFGTGRIGAKKRLVARFCRQWLRMLAEIVCARFSWETMAEMSGVALRRRDEIEAELAELEQSLAAAQQAGEEPPHPQVQRLVQVRQEPSVEAVLKVLRSDALRSYSIDVETDSTVVADQEREREARGAVLETLMRAFEVLKPIVDSGALPPMTLPETFVMMLRGLPMSRQLIDAIESWVPPPKEEPPPPEVVRAQSQERIEEMRLAREAIENERNRQVDLQKEILKITDQEQERRVRSSDAAAERELKASEGRADRELQARATPTDA